MLSIYGLIFEHVVQLHRYNPKKEIEKMIDEGTKRPCRIQSVTL